MVICRRRGSHNDEMTSGVLLVAKGGLKRLP